MIFMLFLHIKKKLVYLSALKNIEMFPETRHLLFCLITKDTSGSQKYINNMDIILLCFSVLLFFILSCMFQ